MSIVLYHHSHTRAANVVWPVRSETRRSILALVKRELGPALLKSLAAYAANLPAA